MLDTHMNAIDATVHVFESQVDVPQQNGCRVNKTYLSVEMPEDIRDFVAIATDPAGQIQSGFCAMDGRLYNGMVDDSWNRMKDARSDDAAYRRWFEQHHAKPGDLACQRVASAAFAYRPLVSIVVPCYKTDRVYLRELLGSALAQSYDNWELLLMDASPEWDAVATLRLAPTTSAFVELSCPVTAALWSTPTQVLSKRRATTSHSWTMTTFWNRTRYSIMLPR